MSSCRYLPIPLPVSPHACHVGWLKFRIFWVCFEDTQCGNSSPGQFFPSLWVHILKWSGSQYNNPHLPYVKSPTMGPTSQLALWALCPFCSPAWGAGQGLLEQGRVCWSRAAAAEPWLKCGRGIPHADSHQGHICLDLMFNTDLKQF